MDFSELKAELAARGLARLTDTQLGTFVNRGVRVVDSAERWPYREFSVTGTAPLAVSDLGFVDQVFDTTGADVSIPMASYGTLVSSYGDLSTTGGAPSYWYLAYPSGVPTVATYPVSTVTIGVQYFRVTPTLVNASDEPLAPEAFHGVYVDAAHRLALVSKSDWEGATAVGAVFQEGLAGMRTDLLYRQGSGPSQILVSDGGDY